MFFDVKFGFYAKHHPRSRILRSGIENPSPKNGQIDLLICFLLSVHGVSRICTVGVLGQQEDFQVRVAVENTFWICLVFSSAHPTRRAFSYAFPTLFVGVRRIFFGFPKGKPKNIFFIGKPEKIHRTPMKNIGT